MGASDSTPFDYDAELFRQKEMQSVEVKSEEVKGDGHPRRYIGYDKRNLMAFPFEDEDVKPNTIWKCFQRGVRKFPDAHCLGTRVTEGYDEKKKEEKRGPYVWQNYREVNEDSVRAGKGIRSLGFAKGAAVGICAPNRAEWTITSLGLYSQSLVTVALYDTLGVDAVEYILDHAEVGIAFVSKSKLSIAIGVLKKCKEKDIPTNLKYIVQFDPNPLYKNDWEAVNPEDEKTCADYGVKLMGFSQLLKLGDDYKDGLDEPEPKDLALIMYTSGTTGVPKGVMLTHGNIVADVAGALAGPFDLLPTDRHLSYLPLAHIFESLVQVGMLVGGGAIGFSQGNIKKLTDDIKTLEPTIFAGVPRVFTRMHEVVMDKIKNSACLQRWLFLKALHKTSDNVRRGQPVDAFYDAKIFSKVRLGMGLHKCRKIVSGAAPLPPFLAEFLKVAVNPAQGVQQGYGLTETSAAMSVTAAQDHTLGHVGPPMPCSEMKLRSVPDMGYDANADPPRGEVLGRGPNVFVGYYKNKEATAEVLDKDGWFSTGDVGRWNPNGTLSIIDRKKNCFKLAQGEYVASEKLEQTYGRASLVNQVFVYGNSYKSILVAVVVPSAANTVDWLKTKGWWHSDAAIASEDYRKEFQKVCTEHKEELRAEVLSQILAVGKKYELKGFELVKDVHLEVELDEVLQGFTVKNDCMTPTFKLRRPYLLKRYFKEIQDLYTKHGEAPKPDERWT